VADLIHHLPVRAGVAFFIPSGRIHAIGAGNVIFEVQQNSDTTYRVFDWNRVGLDGKPRELHVEESLKAINFDDPEPDVIEPRGELLVECEFFRVEKWTLAAPRYAPEAGFAVYTALSGGLACAGREFRMGDFFLVSAAQTDREIRPLEEGTAVLQTTILSAL
jgi:mannose-6-phosphate isomerase